MKKLFNWILTSWSGGFWLGVIIGELIMFIYLTFFILAPNEKEKTQL